MGIPHLPVPHSTACQNWGPLCSERGGDSLRNSRLLAPWVWPTLTLGLFSTPSPLPSSIWLLLKNPTFILLCLAGATEATLITGMSTFSPKFLESQFSLSASEAATLFGEKTLDLGGPLLLCQFSEKQRILEDIF